MNAPLKGGRVEDGQSLLDLGGEEDEDLFSRTTFRRAPVTPEEDAAYMDAVKRPDANERTVRLAPNGKRSNLANALYHLVRTKRFKDWFGDWERKARIDKLHNSKSIDFRWNGEYELNRNAARSWALDNLRKGYVNDDTGDGRSCRCEKINAWLLRPECLLAQAGRFPIVA